MADQQPQGSMALLTRLAKVAYRRSQVDSMRMSLRQYGTLTFLRDHGAVAQSALAEVLCMDANNIVLLLNELEGLDLARRVRDPRDRRRHVVELTEHGIAEQAKAEEELEAVEDSVFAGLDASERKTMHRLLAKALASADDPAAAEREELVAARA